MRGLIGTANNNKNGLMSKDDYNEVARNVIFSGEKLYKIIDLTNNGDWVRNGFHILGTDDNINITEIIGSCYKNSGSLFCKYKNLISSTTFSFKVYQKNFSVYLYTDWPPSTLYYAHFNSQLYPQFISSGLDDSYTEISSINT